MIQEAERKSWRGNSSLKMGGTHISPSRIIKADLLQSCFAIEPSSIAVDASLYPRHDRGAVIQLAWTIEIVPTNDTLLVNAKVRPVDIAFIRPGQRLW